MARAQGRHDARAVVRPRGHSSRLLFVRLAGAAFVQAAGEVAAHERAVLALDFDPAIVQLDKAVDERETKAGTRPLAGAVLGRKSLEHIGSDLWRDARTSVGNRDLYILSEDCAAKRDGSAARRVFEGVREQIEDDLLNAPLVANELPRIRRTI